MQFNPKVGLLLASLKTTTASPYHNRMDSQVFFQFPNIY